MSFGELILFAFAWAALGAVAGAWLAWHIWLRKEKPVQHIVVDREVLATVTQKMAFDWAESRGLTWMPRGAVFDSTREIPK